MKMLMGYHYPGNVRELENLIERVVILTEEETIRPAVLPVELRQGPSVGSPAELASYPFSEAQERFEREYIERNTQ